MTSGDNRIVQGLWVGGRLSTLERLCIRSFCAHGHEFHLYHYDELHNVPRIDGLRVINGEEILPRTAIFRSRKGSLAYFSDRFRWELLRQRGGWWMDMDVICVRPLDFPDDIVFQRDVKPDRMPNGFLKLPRGHFLAAALADTYKDINRIQPWDNFGVRFKKIKNRLILRNSPRHIRLYHCGGMFAFSSAVKHFGLDKHALPTGVFHAPGDPQGHDAIKSAGYDFDALLSSAPDMHCVHISQSRLVIKGIDKDGDYPADSLYEVLKRRYPEARQ